MPVLGPLRLLFRLAFVIRGVGRAQRPAHRSLNRCCTPSIAPLVAAVLLGSLAGGCAIDPVRDAQQLLDKVPPNALAEARQLERADQPAAAAEAYLKLAESMSPPVRQQLEIEAAGALLRAGDSQRASRLLAELDQTALTGAQRELALLLQADIAISRGRAAEAINTLDRVNQGTLPKGLKQRYLGSLAAAYRLGNQPIRAAAELDRLDRLLDNREARLDNQVSLLFTLASLDNARLSKAADSANRRMRGWIELAQLLTGQATKTPEVASALNTWRRRNGSGHPAMPGLDEAYFSALAGGYPAGAIAEVLLPTRGRFGVAGDAIRDGISAAYKVDRSRNRPELGFGSDSLSSYNAKVEAGADMVIGPLEKSSVTALVGRGALPVPTLALNRADGPTTQNLFQFSLAPEDEAINAANLAFASGFKRAALVYPQNAWGTRMADAFRSQWRALGGTLVAQPAYGSINAAVDAVASSNPEVVLIVATSKSIGPLWEALRLNGVNAPGVATSHVYDGKPNPRRDQALDGLYFVDIPWLLDEQRSDQLSRQALRGRLRDVSGPLARLYAMGIDAYRLAPRVTEMQQQPGTFFPGETGGLSINARGEVQRQLTLARFTRAGIITPPGIVATAPQAAAEPE